MATNHLKMKKDYFIVLFIFWGVLSFTIRAEKMVRIVSKSGNAALVNFVGVNENKLEYQTSSGKKGSVDLEELSIKSQNVIENWKRSKEESFGKSKEINSKLGITLFGENLLWEEQASVVSARLKWPQESKSKYSSSYRYYPPESYRFLNAYPYSATLYGGEDGKVSYLSLIFANKGDYNSDKGSGEDHFESNGKKEKKDLTLESAIKKDFKTIQSLLTECLGEAEVFFYGEKEERARTWRWDHQEHSILLSTQKGDYTRVVIVPKKLADKRGKANYIKDAIIKEQILKNVRKEKNEDVYIENIPMVDQGRKGYCAPATFERVMRYMFVPADMYVLAITATKPGGGTYTGLLAENAAKMIRSKLRSIKTIETKEYLKMKKIERIISEGIPIMWSMYSTKNYNKITNINTKKRKTVKDFKDWKRKIKEEASKFSFVEEGAHVCIIVGYNKNTNEIAVSDSWGESYERRWISLDIAKKVSLKEGYIIGL